MFKIIHLLYLSNLNYALKYFSIDTYYYRQLWTSPGNVEEYVW